MSKTIVHYPDAQACTSCGDVLLLLEYKGSAGKRSYWLYKVYNPRMYNSDWFYFMQIDGEKYPVPLIENIVFSFLQNPEKGEQMAKAIWFDRRR